MVHPSIPNGCSFAELDPFAYGVLTPLHGPPARLPENVVACAGRPSVETKAVLAAPAFFEDLLIIHLRFPKRLLVKLGRWFQVDSTPGDLAIIPRGQPSIWRSAGAVEALILSLPPALLRKSALQDAAFDPARVELIPRVGQADPLVYAIGQAIVGELQMGGLFGLLYLETLCRTLALHLLRHHAFFPTTPAPMNGRLSAEGVRRVHDYVHEHLACELTLESLAALVHLSPYHFARRFKAATGLPPYQYVLQCRVAQAKTLLVAGRHAISEVAQAVGFASQSHLARHIKRTFGVAPGALLPTRKNRQKVRKNGEDFVTETC